jgi:endo-1,4-beta-xylanase
MKFLFIVVVFVVIQQASAHSAEPALKDAFADDFRVGAAVGTRHIIAGDESSSEVKSPELELVAREYNTITPENLLKFAEVHPEPGRYNFEPADRYVEFGEKHGMWIVGHALVWHNQTPLWAFETDDEKPLDRETALANMKEHITTVVGRYKGRIDAWDVVNEAINDEGKLRTGRVGLPGQRGEPWHAAIGDDYIEHAFRWAHETDPDAELYYNDFNEWYPAKIPAISKLILDLKAKGVRIDGLGLQGHWGLDYPTLDEIDHMLTEYGKLGVKLMITELDIDVLHRENSGADIGQQRPRPTGSVDKLNAEQQQALAERYAELFRIFVKHSDKIDRVTFWGVHDGHSWLNDRGAKNHPLLFDRQLKPKPAFAAVVAVAEEQ